VLEGEARAAALHDQPRRTVRPRALREELAVLTHGELARHAVQEGPRRIPQTERAGIETCAVETVPTLEDEVIRRQEQVVLARGECGIAPRLRIEGMERPVTLERVGREDDDALSRTGRIPMRSLAGRPPLSALCLPVLS
jgi:hypothetical protein